MIEQLLKLSPHKLICSAATVCLLLGCLPAFYVGRDYFLKRKYEHGLDSIQIGDSERAVVSLMGQGERNWCYPLRDDHDSPEQKQFHEQCVYEYSYEIFLQRYIVTFDKNNHVSGKYKMFSP